jgi:hypothetical protein
MGLSEFHDILLPIILHYSSDISDKNTLPVHPRNTQNFGWNFLNIQPYGWVASIDATRHP